MVLELAGGRMIGIEVKATAAPREGDASHLRWLRDEMGDRFAAGVVFHTGPRTFELERAITAAPIAALWS